MSRWGFAYSESINWQTIIVIVGLIYAIALFLWSKDHVRLTGLLMLISFILLGVMRFNIYDKSDTLASTQSLFDKTLSYSSVVVSDVKQKNRICNCIVESQSVFTEDSIVVSNHKINVRVLSKDSICDEWKIGDRLLIKGSPKSIKANIKPSRFDYKQYMANNNIYFQQFIYANKVSHIPELEINSIWNYAQKARDKLKNIIEQKTKNSNNQAMASALLLGVKDDLSSDVKASFAASGAMHILAVSGLHVGMILLLLNLVLKYLPNTIYFRAIIKPLLIFASLWSYALITGFSPSVFRAVMMFSILYIGSLFRSNQNLYNTLAIAAFVQLLISPNQLFATGFQLSYLAVLGILYFHPKIFALIQPKNFLLRKIWELTCISISVQIATAPISIYYFQQFPIYFLIANPIVILLAFTILILGIVVLFTSFLPYFDWLAWLFNLSLEALNFFTQFIESIDGSVLHDLSLEAYHMVLIYSSMLLLIAFFHLRIKLFFFISIAALWLMSFIDIVESYNFEQEMILDLKKKMIYIKTENEVLSIKTVEMAKGIYGFVWQGKKYIGLHKKKQHELDINIVTDYLIVPKTNHKHQITPNMKYQKLLMEDHSQFPPIVKPYSQ